jgi:ferredoxin
MMPRLIFDPSGVEVEADANTKILSAALKAKISIQYGCASCRCGTCGIRVDSGNGTLSPMAADERQLLAKMSLDTAGEIRLACRARIMDGTVRVDLAFQLTYSPDQGDDEDDDD